MHSPKNQKMDTKKKIKIWIHEDIVNKFKNQEREKSDLCVSYRGLDLFKSTEVIDMFWNIGGNRIEPYWANKSDQ